MSANPAGFVRPLKAVQCRPRDSRARLTATEVRTARAADKPVKLTDGGGLYLHVLPSGVRTWRIKYRVAGRSDELTIGRFPEIGLADARSEALRIRTLAARGIDPKAADAADRAAREAHERIQADTFGRLADAYYAARSPGWSATHQRDVRRMLDELKSGGPADPALPRTKGLADVPLRALRKPAVRNILDVIAARGALTYARDVLTYCRAVVAFYNAGQDDPIADPTAGLRTLLPEPANKSHHAALDAAEMPAFLQALNGSAASAVTLAAVRLLMLTAVRTNELRWAKWTEFDLDARIWFIPVERMKYRRRVSEPHRVPLSTQAIDVLDRLRPITGDKPLLFPNERGGGAPISENRILNAIYGIGYRGRMTGHGFRSVFSSTINERGFHADAIERQLAHVDANAVRAAYNRGAFWEERVRLMQAWAEQINEWERRPTTTHQDMRAAMDLPSV